MNKKDAPLELSDLVERRRVALDAEVDVKTLDRALRGEPVRPSSLHRIRRALAARGLDQLLSTSSTTSAPLTEGEPR